MVWNSLLACIPLGFAVFLFTGPRTKRGPFWWAGLAIFVAFLPNGPYVITDLIHLKSDALALRAGQGGTLALVLEYSLFVLVGVVAYAGSLELLRRYLLAHGWSTRAAFMLELVLHALSAVGVLLGRLARFNSWELVTRPDDVVGHTLSRVDSSWSWMLLVTTFVVITVTTLLLRFVATGFAVVSRGVSRRL
jgi:uncharacterized membrane protein